MNRPSLKSSLIDIVVGVFLIAASVSWISISSMREIDTNTDALYG